MPDRLPAPPPLEANTRRVTLVLMGAWAIALATLLVARHDLPAGAGWWIWTCVSGLAMGVFGLWFVPRLTRSRAQAEAKRAGAGPPPA